MLLENKGLEVLKASATWCGACKIIKPYFDEFKGKGFNIKEFDAEEYQDYSVNVLKIKNLPTVIIFKDGMEVERLTGRKSKKEYEEVFEKYK